MEEEKERQRKYKIQVEQTFKEVFAKAANTSRDLKKHDMNMKQVETGMELINNKFDKARQTFFTVGEQMKERMVELDVSSRTLYRWDSGQL